MSSSNEHKRSEEPRHANARRNVNRILGLSSYAGGVILLGLLVLSIVDAGGIRGDLTSLGIIALASLACFAIGYSTGRRN